MDAERMRADLSHDRRQNGEKSDDGDKPLQDKKPFQGKEQLARSTGSLSRRMTGIAATWITILLLIGGFALDRAIQNLVQRNFDERLSFTMSSMIASVEIGPEGEILFSRTLSDQRFLEPESGQYWQISGEGFPEFPSRSLWDRTLIVHDFSNDSGDDMAHAFSMPASLVDIRADMKPATLAAYRKDKAGLDEITGETALGIDEAMAGAMTGKGIEPFEGEEDGISSTEKERNRKEISPSLWQDLWQHIWYDPSVMGGAVGNRPFSDLTVLDNGTHIYNSDQFSEEPLRVVQRDVKLPDSSITWRFLVAADRSQIEAEIGEIRYILINSFIILAVGLIILAALQTLYGLWPLRKIRNAIQAMRTGKDTRVSEPMPRELLPMVNELNALLAYNERQAEEARRHAGNLAHALKTPLTVLVSSAESKHAGLGQTVLREAATMRRQIDHHLARARALGRRGSVRSRANPWNNMLAVRRAIQRLYNGVSITMAGEQDLCVAVEEQDVDELLGNIVENAAKYGNGQIFVHIKGKGEFAEIIVEDNGPGIPKAERASMFNRGTRLDMNKPGTGLGLAIVYDVAEIYDGTIILEKSDQYGGLRVKLSLPLTVCLDFG